MSLSHPPRSQTADALVLVRPARFGFNPETAASNTFQQNSGDPEPIARQALLEHDALVALLQAHDIEVHVLHDPPEPACPDAVFPNNWFSTDDGGHLLLYPMAAPNRRLERRPDWIPQLEALAETRVRVDLTHLEHEGLFLEGTGSLVLDRVARIAYAAVSVRTHPHAARLAARLLGGTWQVISFPTRHPSGVPLYHTNVMLAIGANTAVLAPELIATARARSRVERSLGAAHTLVRLSLEQVEQYAGNLLQVQSRTGTPYWVMSSAAYSALTPEQREVLATDAQLLHSPIPTIERVGGGSVRCMLSEIVRPKRQGPRGR